MASRAARRREPLAPELVPGYTITARSRDYRRREFEFMVYGYRNDDPERVIFLLKLYTNNVSRLPALVAERERYFFHICAGPFVAELLNFTEIRAGFSSCSIFNSWERSLDDMTFGKQSNSGSYPNKRLLQRQVQNRAFEFVFP